MSTLLPKVKIELMILGIIAVPKKHFPRVLQPYHSLISRIYTGIVLILLLPLPFSALYFVSFEAKTFGEYAESSLFFVATVLQMTFYFVVMYSKREIMDLIDELDQIIEQRCIILRNVDIYAAENAKSRLFERFLSTILYSFVVMFIISSTLVSYYFYYASNSSIGSFKLLFAATVPWNWKSPSTYLAAVCLQGFWLQSTCFMVVCSLTLFSTFCMSFCAIAIDIRECFLNLTFISQRPHSSENKRFEKFTKLIQFHAISINLPDRFSVAYGFDLTAVFLTSSTLVCCGLLSLNVAFRMGSTVDILRMTVCLSTVVIYLIVLCLFGYEVTLRFDEIDEAVYLCSWTEFPSQIQKLWPLIMNITQNPIYIHGYFNDQCTREFLKKVISAAFSYYTVLRGVDH